jgi:hypothetical protein
MREVPAVRKYGLAAAALMALASIAKSDGSTGPAYGVSPALSWTGCHAGVAAGGAFARSEKWVVRTPGGPSSASRSADTR